MGKRGYLAYIIVVLLDLYLADFFFFFFFFRGSMFPTGNFFWTQTACAVVQ